MQPAGVPQVGPFALEIKSAVRVARPAFLSSAAAFALRSHRWTAIETATVRFNLFISLAYGVVDDAGGEDVAAQGERTAMTLDNALSFRLHRILRFL